MALDDRSGLPDPARRHYALGAEEARLAQGAGRLEFTRSKELLTRYLPGAPATVLDVGGGPGRYAFWLAETGYEVHLVDAVPLHVDQARAHAAAPRLASATVGDARELEFGDASMDAVVLFGPLYHLTERSDRVQALRESARVLRRGGVLLAAVISRFASTLDGLASGRLIDPVFRAIVDRDLEDGQHRNPTDHPAYFTTAYFHHPNELAEELIASGLAHEATLAVEGPAWITAGLDAQWTDDAQRERLLEAVRRVESEPTLLGASAHLIAVGRKE